MDMEKETTMDAAFLMEQMELREELEQARSQADPYDAVFELRGRINKKINTLVGQMAVQFESATPEQLEASREILRKMRFLQRLRAEVEAAEAEIEDAL